MREIKAFPITCNINKKCEWEGTVGSLEEHKTACKFALVPCPKLCNSVEFMRKNLHKHLKKCPNRDHECPLCGEKGGYVSMTQDHDKSCKKQPVPCPGCGDAVERQQVPEHVSKCPHTVIPCKYKGIGCDAELERKDMAAHEQDDKLHLHMALDTVTSQQDAMDQQRDAIEQQEDAIEQQQDAINLLQDDVRTLQKYKTPTFALTEYQKKKEAKNGFSSPSFYTRPNGYHMKIRVHANGDGTCVGTHVSVFAHILGGRYDARLNWPFVGQVTVTLLNQLENDNHHTKTINFTSQKNAMAGKNLGTPWFISHHKLAHDPDENTQYLKDDTLYFRVNAEVADHKPWLELPWNH